MPRTRSPAPPQPLRELSIAALLALALGGVVVGRPLWDGERVALATDAATAQAPWRAVEAARNPELYEPAVLLYPAHRRVSERWRGGEVPLWNPDLQAGLPLLANPRWGVLDPQVLALVGLEILGGPGWFDRGLAWLALGRVAAAALGGYLLARTLGLGRRGAALGACGFALSGSLVLRLGGCAGHVVPFLPWVLLGVEALGGRRRGLAFAGTALALALSIYGGHPETAFFVGLVAVAWAWIRGKRDRIAGRLALGALAGGTLLAAPLLVPFVEYLQHSGALLAHRLDPGPRELPDLLALGLLTFAFAVPGLLGAFAESPWRRVGLWVFFFALLAVLTRRGLELPTAAAGGALVDRARLWLPLPVLALAAAGLLAGEKGPQPVREGRILGVAALLLALGTPGVVDLWRWLPLAGRAATAPAACIAALFLAMAAGAALESSTVGLRRTAAGLVVVAGFFLLDHGPPPVPPELARVDPPDEVLVYDQRPPPAASGGEARLEGTIFGGLGLDALTLVVERLDPGAGATAARFTRAASLGERRPDGSRRFGFGPLHLDGLAPGIWRFQLEFAKDGGTFSRRTAAVTRIGREVEWSGMLAAVAAGTLALLWFGGSGRGANLLLALAVLHGLAFARGWSPSVPLGEHFPLSRTEAFLAKAGPGERILAEAGILPGNTALVRGLTTVGGSDAVIDWDARGVDVESPAFRLLGVRRLLFHQRRELEGWRLVAGPEGAPAGTEVWILEAEDPLPRAFCVPRIVSREEALADPAGFDPRASAFLEPSHPVELERPFRSARVRELAREPETLEYDVELDGEGLFLVTDQHFPGWRATVDGGERRILRADSVFRAVHLPAGTHRVRFEYAPESWALGLRLGIAGLLSLLVGSLAASRWKRSS